MFATEIAYQLKSNPTMSPTADILGEMKPKDIFALTAYTRSFAGVDDSLEDLQAIWKGAVTASRAQT